MPGCARKQGPPGVQSTTAISRSHALRRAEGLFGISLAAPASDHGHVPRDRIKSRRPVALQDPQIPARCFALRIHLLASEKIARTSGK